MKNIAVLNFLLFVGFNFSILSAQNFVSQPGWQYISEEAELAWLQEQGAIAEVEEESPSFLAFSASASSESNQDCIPEADEANDELRALARGLDYDPEKIYHWIRENIDFSHIYGLNKGAIQTFNERAGNSFDQSCLFAALLNECPSISNIKYKLIYENYNASTLSSLHRFQGASLGRMRGYMNLALRKRGAVGTPTANRYAWCHVEFKMGEDIYLVNPALKKYVWNQGLISNVTEWKALFDYRTNEVTDSLTGNSDPQGGWIEGISGSIGGLENKLEEYTDSLILALRSQYPGKSLNDLLGYWSVAESAIEEIPGKGRVVNSTFLIDEWIYGKNPKTYAQSFVFKKGNSEELLRVYSARLKGEDFSMTFDSSNRATFKLGNEVLARDDQATSSDLALTWGVNHPLGVSGFANRVANRLREQVFRKGEKYSFEYSWDPKGTRYLDSLEKLQKLESSNVSTGSDEYILEALSAVGRKYLHEESMWAELNGRLHKLAFARYHSFGRVIRRASGGFAVDYPFFVTMPAHTNGAATTSFGIATAMPGSALEHSVLNQLQGDDAGGVSTVGVISRALRSGQRMSYVDKNTLSAFKETSKGNDWRNAFGKVPNTMDKYVLDEGAKTSGYWLLPQEISYNFGTYNGPGFFQVTSEGGVTAGIGGGLKGGGSSGSPFRPEVVTGITDFIQPSFDYSPPSAAQSFGADPVDMVSGSFTLDVSDIAIGNEPWPRGIEFSRRYSSARKEEKTDLSPGWSHNFQSSLGKISNADLFLGRGTSEEAASIIVATIALRDMVIPSGASRTAKRMAAGILITDWAANILSNSVYSVNLGDKNIDFVEVYPGEVLPARGLPLYLRKVNSNRIEVKSRWGNKFIFNKIGGSNGEFKITEVHHPDGGNAQVNYHSDGRINFVQDLYGRRLQFGYSGNRINLLTDSTINDGPSAQSRNVQFFYNDKGNLWKDEDPEDRSHHYVYNDDHLMTKHQDHDRRVIVENFYDGFGRVERQLMNSNVNKEWLILYAETQTVEVNPKGGRITHYFDDHKRRVSLEDAEGNRSYTIYDDQDHVVETVSEDGDRSNSEYDGFHNLLSSVFPRGGGQTIFEYEQVAFDAEFNYPLFRINQTTDVEKHIVDYQYNADNKSQRPDRVVDEEGTTHLQYYPTGVVNGSEGRLRAIRNSDNLTTSYTYNSNGDHATTVAPGGGANFTTTYQYNDRGDLDFEIDQKAVKTDYTYNQARQVLDVVRDKDGEDETKTSQTYNNYGLVDSVISAPDNDGQSVRTRTEYTVTGNPEFEYLENDTAILEDDKVVEYKYDERDWLVSQFDAAGRETQTIYFKNQRIKEKILIPGMRKTSFEYDKSGRNTLIVAPGANVLPSEESSTRTTGYQYAVSESAAGDSSNGFPKTINIDSDNKVTISELNRLGRLRFHRNKKNNVFEMRYDALGRNTHVISPLDAEQMRSSTIEYAHRGVPTLSTEPSGDSAMFNYSPVTGRLETIDYKKLDGGTETVRYDHSDSYDENNNVTHLSEGGLHTYRTYDRLDRIKTSTDSNDQTIGYRYYKSGRLHKLIYPGGNENGIGHVEYTYWKTGRLKNVIDRLSSIVEPRITTYHWRNDGRLERIERANETERSVEYDSAGRPNLVQEFSSSGTLIHVSKHDYYDNDDLSWSFKAPKLSAEAQGPMSPINNATYHIDNSLDEFNGKTIIHDADGNMEMGPLPDGSMVSYSYDSRNRLSAVDGISYSYSPDGARLFSGDNGGVSYVVENKLGLSKILQRSKNGSVTRYVWGAGLLYEVKEDNRTFTYHYNSSGSTIALTDDDELIVERMEYSPFGQTLGRESLDGDEVLHDTPFLFTGFFGNQTDANGLIYMRARYYNPLLRRFLNVDPAREGWNWYGYAGGNPIGFVDPSGLGLNSALDSIQTGLSFLGLIPVIGNFFDGINAAISVGRGDYGAAALNVASAIPGFGIGAGAVSLGARSSRFSGNAFSPSVRSSFSGNLFSGSSGCFVAGTKIKTSDGTKPIEEIRIGDQVFSRCELTGAQGFKSVVNLFRTYPTRLVHLTYRKKGYKTHSSERNSSSDDDSDSESRILTGTIEHPFWSVDRKSWVDMVDVLPNETLLIDDGSHVIVEDKVFEDAKPGEHYSTYNFEVEDWNTYYVSTHLDDKAPLFVWVHNRCYQGVVNAINRNADIAVALAERYYKRRGIIPGAQTFGNTAHAKFDKLNRRLNRQLRREGTPFRVASEEFRDAAGNVVRGRPRGSIGPDVSIRNLNGFTVGVFDLKTFGRNPLIISRRRQAEFRRRGFGQAAQEINRRRPTFP